MTTDLQPPPAGGDRAVAALDAPRAPATGGRPRATPDPGTSRRAPAIDGLRGLLVLIMAVDHFGGPIMRFTFEPFGFVSAAEGFVFLAGLAGGLAYTRYAGERSYALERRAGGRAWRVYRYHVLAVLALLAIAAISPCYGDYWARRNLDVRQPLAAAGFALLLVNQPHLLDVLPMYVVFLAGLPIALRQFAAGRAALVLAASAALWVCTQWSAPPLPPAAWGLPHGVTTTDFDYRAWQLLFVVGLWCGHRQATGNGFRCSRALVAVSLAVVVPLFLLRHGLVGAGGLRLEGALARDPLGWLRLLDFAATAVLACALLRRVPALVQRPWLCEVGRRSLPIFVIHAIAIYLVDPVRWRLPRLGAAADVAGALAFAGGLVLVAQALRRRSLRAAPSEPSVADQPTTRRVP